MTSLLFQDSFTHSTYVLPPELFTQKHGSNMCMWLKVSLEYTVGKSITGLFFHPVTLPVKVILLVRLVSLQDSKFLVWSLMLGFCFFFFASSKLLNIRVIKRICSDCQLLFWCHIHMLLHVWVNEDTWKLFETQTVVFFYS